MKPSNEAAQKMYEIALKEAVRIAQEKKTA